MATTWHCGRATIPRTNMAAREPVPTKATRPPSGLEFELELDMVKGKMQMSFRDRAGFVKLETEQAARTLLISVSAWGKWRGSLASPDNRVYRRFLALDTTVWQFSNRQKIHAEQTAQYYV